MDAHRSPAFVISAYTKRSTVVHKFYNTINMIRTIEDLLGMNYLGMNDANSDPMSDVFTTRANLTPYNMVVPGSLCAPPVDPGLVPECHEASVPRTPAVTSLHDGEWWANATKNFNFKEPDALDAAAFNRVLWEGMMGSRPYPAGRSGHHGSDARREQDCSECMAEKYPRTIPQLGQ